MNNEHYTGLLDDAQAHLTLAKKKVYAARDLLFRDGDIGTRMGNRKAIIVEDTINLALHQLDDLPAALTMTMPKKEDIE